MTDYRNLRNIAIITLIAVSCLIFVFIVEANYTCRNGALAERLKGFSRLRSDILKCEFYEHVGGRITLSAKETQANQIIMAAKNDEYQKGLADPDNFLPSRNFLEVYEKINASPLYKMISMMPKGGILHCHDLALCSINYLLQLTYRKDLWICVEDEDYKRMKFSRSQPKREGCCEWMLLSELRIVKGADNVDKELAKKLSLFPEMQAMDTHEVWQVFESIFGLVYGLLTYKPVWRDYMYRMLEEFYADGIQYVEMRSILPLLYDMESTNYTILDTMAVIQTSYCQFQAMHMDFTGMKVIYAPLRNVSYCTFREYLSNAIILKQTFKDFFAGFDLVGCEDQGRPLIDYANDLMSVEHLIDFYFHAGETKWSGTSTDINLIDAVLLGSKRIGHAFALLKHPEVLRIIKRKQIAIEVSPISNQMLQYVGDFRNHPAAHLLADNYPVVISSDDPSFWKSAPISHDYYITFLGIASRSADIGMLKQLVWNSLYYSALDKRQKAEAIEKWSVLWNIWIDRLINMQN